MFYVYDFTLISYYFFKFGCPPSLEMRNWDVRRSLFLPSARGVLAYTKLPSQSSDPVDPGAVLIFLLQN